MTRLIFLCNHLKCFLSLPSSTIRFFINHRHRCFCNVFMVGSVTIMCDFFLWSPSMVQQCDFCDVLLKSNLCSCIFRLVFIFLESQNLAVSLDTPPGPITPIRASICIWQLWKFFIADLFVTEPCINPSQR